MYRKCRKTREKEMWLGGGALLAAAVGVGVFLHFKFKRTIPKGAVAVKPFDVKKYLGHWYEIARLDYMFEKCLNNVTAYYSLNADGSVKVVNRGYNYKKDKDVESEGKAVFAGDPEEAKLKVTFFGPFYGGYNVIDIDPEYKYALVVGESLHYMWILSREKSVPKDIKDRFLRKAEDLGYNTSKLIWTKHTW
ncbi:MAG: lipocalin family protein [Bacteroides sp.]|nr:lipocalin family protein [Bacteroides sp.]